MEIREFRPDDARHIQQVARESLNESYSPAIDGETIDDLIEQWYADHALEKVVSDESSLLVVAANDEISGYAEGEILGGETVVGDIHWIHVRPDTRGEGIGVQLLGELVNKMEGEGASVIRGRVIEANEDGVAFFEEHDFEHRSTRTVDIEGAEFDEFVYRKRVGEDASEEVVGTFEGPDGQKLYIDYVAGETGVEAPLYPTYTDSDMEQQYGWFCSNCGSGETVMDSAGRIECTNCGNTRAATRWDGSYL